jgi:hypothetical protein
MGLLTSPLYGILVTQKSWQLALRSLSQQQYAHHLAHKIVEARLPPELCDEIGAHLSTLLYQGAKDLWKAMKDDPYARTDKFNDFGRVPPTTESGQAFMAEFRALTQLDVPEGRIKVVAEETKIGLSGAEGDDQRYVHLSASLKSPGVSLLLAPGVEAYGGGPAMVLADGEMTVAIEPAGVGQRACEEVRVRWDGAGGVHRLVQLDDVGASIRGCNQEFVEGIVAQMDLRVVNLGGEEGPPGGGMRPGLRLLQHWRWDLRE